MYSICLLYVPRIMRIENSTLQFLHLGGLHESGKNILGKICWVRRTEGPSSSSRGAYCDVPNRGFNDLTTPSVRVGWHLGGQPWCWLQIWRESNGFWVLHFVAFNLGVNIHQCLMAVFDLIKYWFGVSWRNKIMFHWLSRVCFQRGARGSGGWYWFTRVFYCLASGSWSTSVGVSGGVWHLGVIMTTII